MQIDSKDKLPELNFEKFIERVFCCADPSTTYLPNWHIGVVAEHLQEVANGNMRRLIINIPPRSLKSICVSVAFPAWLLGVNPATRIMAASYSNILSIKHSLDTRLVLESDWYRQMFPATVICDDQNEKSKFVTTKRGFRFATSVGGSATGEGADILIVDDPHNPLQAASQVQRQKAINWFEQTFSTRLNNKKKGAIIIVMQRLHADDLSGRMLKKGGWKHLCLPAVSEKRLVYYYDTEKKIINVGDYLHPDREGAEEIATAKRELGSQGFAAQYQQMPMRLKGGMVEPGWIKRYENKGEGLGIRGKKDSDCFISQSWDTAIKLGGGNDYSACTTWMETKSGYYLLDVVALRLEYPALKSKCIALAKKWNPKAILIEDKGSGQSLLQDLRASTKLPLIAINPKGDKITRFARVTTLFEAGRIYLPDQATWLEDYETQLFSFPNIPHDDMVDSTSQYLNRIRDKRNGPRVRGL